MKPLVVLLVGGMLLGRLWWKRRQRAARQRRLMHLCERAGLEFAPWDLAVDTAWLPFPMFGRTPSGTENVVWDRARGPEIRTFDFWYEETSEETTRAPRRRLTCAVVPVAAEVPRLRIAPRGLADDLRSALGLPEVRLELERFNRRFVVGAEDPRFAIAFLEPRMMEGLLALPEDVTLEVNDGALLLWAPLLPAEQVLVLFDVAAELSERVPRVLSSLYPPRAERGPHEERWMQGRWSPEPTEDRP